MSHRVLPHAPWCSCRCCSCCFAPRVLLKAAVSAASPTGPTRLTGLGTQRDALLIRVRALFCAPRCESALFVSLTSGVPCFRSDLPTYLGGSGTCQGLNLCSAARNVCTTGTCVPGVSAGVPACQNATRPTSYSTAVKLKTCTQSTDARCTTAFLTSLFSPYAAVVAAYCNDAFLVVVTYTAPWTFSNTAGGHNLDMMNSVVFPPQGGTNNICNTRQGSYTCSAVTTTKFPLNFNATLLPTDSPLNNANTAVFGDNAYAGADSGGWILLNSRNAAVNCNSNPNTVGCSVGLPNRGATGLAFNGQTIFPQYNNVGYRDVEQCNLNACGEHSGGGGGLPHFHLDGFSNTGICYYGPANYANYTAHPPLIAFALDGGWIYGRHLYAGSEGSTVVLDNCGGHIHPSTDVNVNNIYHYHSQVLTANSTGSSGGGWGSAGTTYTYSTMGPSNCWRGNASTIPNFNMGGADSYSNACTGATQYYFNVNAGLSSNNNTWTASTCGLSGSGSPSSSTPSGNTVTSTPSGNTDTSTAKTVTASMTLVGITSSQFQGTVRTAFVSTLASQLGVSASNISITGVTETTTASSGRHLLATAINVAFTVTTTNAASAAISTTLTSITVGSGSTSFVSALTAAGCPVTGVAAQAPSPSASGAAGGAAKTAAAALALAASVMSVLLA